MIHRILAAALCLAAASAIGQEPAAPPPPTGEGLTEEQARKLIEQIALVQQEFAKTKKQVIENALVRYKDAASSEANTIEFYLACHRVVNIDRKPAATKEEQQERDSGEWRKRLLASFEDKLSASALRLQLQLLILSLESMAGRDQEALVMALRAYLQNVVAFVQNAAAAGSAEGENGRRIVAVVGRRSERDREEAQREKQRDQKRGSVARMLGESVMGSLFAEAYNLRTFLEAAPKWPQSAGDFRAAYADVILPWYRENRKSELPGVWDEYLRAEMAFHQSTKTPSAYTEWGAGEYKKLYWSKWMDLLTHQVNAAMAAEELMKIVRDNPTHPSLKTWIDELGKLSVQLGGAPAQPSSGN